jgi:hypothetical protein
MTVLVEEDSMVVGTTVVCVPLMSTSVVVNKSACVAVRRLVTVATIVVELENTPPWGVEVAF